MARSDTQLIGSIVTMLAAAMVLDDDDKPAASDATLDAEVPSEVDPDRASSRKRD